jgi:hypothetical protein
MESQTFREQLQGSKPIGSKKNYIIRKLLEFRCLKLAHMTHLNIKNTSYGQKKGQGNHPDFPLCRWHATYRWKDLDERYNFSSNFILIEGLYIKVWGLKVVGVPTMGISGLPLGSPRTK